MSANTVIRIGILSLLIQAIGVADGPRLNAEDQPGKTFYVSPNGNNAWSGTLPEPNAAGTDGPLASISAARDVVRKLGGPDSQTAPVSVMLRGGTYLLTKPVVFEPRELGH